jgi:hypothetical protein
MLNQMSGVCNMSRGANATRKQHYPRLLSSYINATRPSFPIAKVTFAEGAKATKFTEWQIVGFIAL